MAERDVELRFADDLHLFLAPGHRSGLVPLRAASLAEVEASLRPGTRRTTYRDFARCADCGRAYWRGAHSPRLEAIAE